MKELLEFIRIDTCDIKIGWIDKKTFASLNRKTDTICINIFLLICESFIHEYMHLKYPYYNAQMQITAIQGIDQSEEGTVALNLAQQQLEQIINADYNDTDLGDNNTANNNTLLSMWSARFTR